MSYLILFSTTINKPPDFINNVHAHVPKSYIKPVSFIEESSVSSWFEFLSLYSAWPCLILSTEPTTQEVRSTHWKSRLTQLRYMKTYITSTESRIVWTWEGIPMMPWNIGPTTFGRWIWRGINWRSMISIQFWTDFFKIDSFFLRKCWTFHSTVAKLWNQLIFKINSGDEVVFFFFYCC